MSENDLMRTCRLLPDHHKQALLIVPRCRPLSSSVESKLKRDQRGRWRSWLLHKHPTRRPSARTIMVHHSQAVIERDSYSLGCFPADLPTGFACQRKGSPVHARTGDWSKAYFPRLAQSDHCSPKAGVKPAGAKSEEERVVYCNGLRGLRVGVHSYAKSA